MAVKTSERIRLYSFGEAKEEYKKIREQHSFFSPEARKARIDKRLARKLEGVDIMGKIKNRLATVHVRSIDARELEKAAMEGREYAPEEYTRRFWRAPFARIRTPEEAEAYNMMFRSVSGLKEKKVGGIVRKGDLINALANRNEEVAGVVSSYNNELLRAQNAMREEEIKQLEGLLAEKEELLKSFQPKAPEAPNLKVIINNMRGIKGSRDRIVERHRKRQVIQKLETKRARVVTAREKRIKLTESEIKAIKRLANYRGMLENLEAEHVNAAEKVFKKRGREEHLTSLEREKLGNLRDALKDLRATLDIEAPKQTVMEATDSRRKDVWQATREVYKQPSIREVLGNKVRGGQLKELKEFTGKSRKKDEKILKVLKAAAETRELDKQVYAIMKGIPGATREKKKEYIDGAISNLDMSKDKLIAKRLLAKATRRK